MPRTAHLQVSQHGQFDEVTHEEPGNAVDGIAVRPLEDPACLLYRADDHRKTWGGEDIFTTALMKRFYQHLIDGNDKGTALRQAKLDLLEKFAAPLFLCTAQASPWSEMGRPATSTDDGRAAATPD